MEEDRKKKPGKVRKRILFISAILAVSVGITAGLAVIYIIGYRTHCGPKSKDAKFQIKNFETALDLYFTDNGSYPTTDQGLQALVTAPIPAPKNYPPDGYMKSIPTDPWGHAYIYRSPGPNRLPYTIESLGADGAEGGEGQDADIESWNLDRKK